MFDEVYALWKDIKNAVNLFSALFPYVPVPVNKRRDRARVELTKILSATARSRKSSNQVEEDTLQKLVDSTYKDGRSTSEEEVTGLIIALLFAGESTSSGTSTWIGACLLSNVKWLTAATEEQRHIIRKYKGRIDYSVLLEMDTLHNCIKETLRMHSAAQVLMRKAHKQFSVYTKEGKEYEIPAGRTILSPIMINSNMPSIFKDPHVYDPDRFGPNRQEDKVCGKFSYTSFGCGRFACIGESFAYLQMKVIWSHLLRNFELKLISPYPKTDWSKLSVEPKGKVMVSYKRRGYLAPSL
jgi:sterol 14-demethylase